VTEKALLSGSWSGDKDMTNVVTYGDATDTTRGPSPIIWGDCPWSLIGTQKNQGAGGFAFYDDFSHTSVVTGDVYQMLGDNAPVKVVDTLDGHLAVTSGGTDNNQSMMAGTVDLAHISDADGEKQKLWFESRWKISAITDVGIFIGLAAEADVAVDFLADNSGDLVAGADAIGFHVLTATPTAVGTVYQKGSAAKQAVETGVHTLVADTYVKTGFIYDPAAPSSSQIKFFVNGAEQLTKVTVANIAAATFPDSVNMTLMATVKTGEGTTKTATMDWWRVAQVAA
jgi:hypothetical protein